MVRRTVTAKLPPDVLSRAEGVDLYALLVDPEATALEVVAGDHDGHLGVLHDAAQGQGARIILRALRRRREALADAPPPKPVAVKRKAPAKRKPAPKKGG